MSDKATVSQLRQLAAAQSHQQDAIQRMELLLGRIAEHVGLPASTSSATKSMSPTPNGKLLRSNKVSASPRAGSVVAHPRPSAGAALSSSTTHSHSSSLHQTEGERTRFGFLLKNRVSPAHSSFSPSSSPQSQQPQAQQPLNLDLNRAASKVVSIDLSSISTDAHPAASEASNSSPSLVLHLSPQNAQSGSAPQQQQYSVSPPAAYRDPASMSPRTLDEARNMRRQRKKQPAAGEVDTEVSVVEKEIDAQMQMLKKLGNDDDDDGGHDEDETVQHKHFRQPPHDDDNHDEECDLITNTSGSEYMSLSGAATPRPSDAIG